MKGFHEVDPAQINDNFIHDIGSDWMLITAGDHVRPQRHDGIMGGVGVIWGFPVAVAVIRPQRYTFGLVEQSDTLTLSFLPEQYREALKYAVRTRDATRTNSTMRALRWSSPTTIPPAIAEARLVLECRKLYADMIKPENFIDRSLIDDGSVGRLSQGIRAAHREGIRQGLTPHDMNRYGYFKVAAAVPPSGSQTAASMPTTLQG